MDDKTLLIKYLRLLLKNLGLYLVIEPDEFDETEIKTCIKILELTKRYNYNFKKGE